MTFLKEDPYTILQPTQIAELLYGNRRSVKNMHRNLCHIYRQYNHRFKSTIKRIVERSD